MTPTRELGSEVDSSGRRLVDAEAKAARLEQWFDLLFETSPVAMGVISIFENRCVRANQALADLYGMSLEEILSCDPFSLAVKITHRDDLLPEQKLFAELVTGARSSYQVEKRYVRLDGSIRWGHLTFAVIFDAANAPGTQVRAFRFVVLQIVDITERKALAEALERRELELRHAQKVDGIGRLAAGVAHDFNNLLTVILGHGEVLRRLVRSGVEGPADEPMLASLDAIVSATERAADLTTQLLAYGRRSPAAPRTLVLTAAVESLQRLLVRTLGPNVEIEQSLTASGAIFADEGQIGQVVMNLVLNARDAIPEGGRIHLTTRDVPEGTPPGSGDWVALIISDTGHGMSPEVQARMFEPFFTTRADRPGTQGTGLGLATVQRIVGEVGGRIDVESAPGKGTAVTVLFPKVVGLPKEAQKQPADVGRVRAPNTQRVLVVEDDPAVRSLIGSVLLAAHYLVTVACDGYEALQFVESEREPFHLIVTDLVMPSIGGVQLAKRLHERGSVPRMLFISGYSDHAPAELVGYGGVLPKPFTPSQLLAAVSQTLDGPQ